MEIYIDLLLIENFVIDMFILLITTKLLRIKVVNSLLIISSLFGSVYTLVEVFPKLKVFSLFPFQIIIAFLMMMILLKGRSIALVTKGTCIYILCAFTLSGVSFGFSLWQNSYSLTMGYSISNYSMKYLIMSIVLVYVVADRAISYIRERALVSNFIYEIEVYINDIRYVIKGFLDTGNELREPVTNLPCIIVEERFLLNYQEDEEKTYYIPYNAIGFSGKLKGFKVDKVLIRGDKEEWREVTAIICPCNDVLSRDKEFNALLSRGVI